MKKLLFVLMLVTYLVSGVFCQSANSSPVDLVVLLDTSASMSGSYRETSNYLIGPFLREFLRIGDTFHLISFSGAPKLEISRRIEGVGDVETIIARLLLMYPLDPESNLSGALSFAESFASSLPSRSKKIVLISDGDAENTQSLVNESSGRFRGLGADLQYIKVPVTGNGPSSSRAPLAQPSQTAQTAQPAQTAQQSAQPSQAAQTAQPAQTVQQETQTSQTTQPVQTTEGTQPSASAQETQSASPGGSQASGPVTTQESGTPSPVQAQSPGQSAGGGSTPASPATGTGQTQSSQSSSGTSGKSSGGTIPLPLIIALAILFLLILIAIFIFASRRLDKSPNRVISKAASPASPKSKAETIPDRFTETRKTTQVLQYPPPRMKPLPKDKVYDENVLPSDGSPVLLNLFVADQNTAIGKRNIHSVKPGYSYTIGGGKSDFLIFLVPVPPRIAEVRHDGRNCSFIPVKPQYFPDIGSQTIPNCIGKTFRVISDKKYELHIRLEKYEDPLHALNKMLRSIKVPGPVV
jgi:hypothetical protein